MEIGFGAGDPQNRSCGSRGLQVSPRCLSAWGLLRALQLGGGFGGQAHRLDALEPLGKATRRTWTCMVTRRGRQQDATFFVVALLLVGTNGSCFYGDLTIQLLWG